VDSQQRRVRIKKPQPASAGTSSYRSGVLVQKWLGVFTIRAWAMTDAGCRSNAFLPLEHVTRHMSINRKVLCTFQSCAAFAARFHSRSCCWRFHCRHGFALLRILAPQFLQTAGSLLLVDPTMHLNGHATSPTLSMRCKKNLASQKARPYCPKDKSVNRRIEET